MNAICINDGWKFKLGDESGQSETGYNAEWTRRNYDEGLIGTEFAAGRAESRYDDGGWRTLDLPHDWGVEYPVDKNEPSGSGGGYARAGVGWYRRRVRVPEVPRGGRAYIRFDGVYMDSTVYIDGVRVGGRIYGYSEFTVEIPAESGDGAGNAGGGAGVSEDGGGAGNAGGGAGAGNAGGGAGVSEDSGGGGVSNAGGVREILVAVRVDNSRQPNSRWYTGSGIYRSVWLVAEGPVHFGAGGVFVTTNGLYDNNAKARLLIKTWVANEGEAPADAGVAHTLADKDGNTVAEAASALRVPAGGEALSTVLPIIEQPVLWSDKTPYLYTLTTKIITDDKLNQSAGGKKAERTVGCVFTRVGIRTAVFDCDRGFLLNGESVKIKGMCLHGDGGLTGAANYAETWERRLKLLKDMGCNGIRCAHNPPSREFLDLCDERGFLVMDEAFDEWGLTKIKSREYGYSSNFTYGYGQYFTNEAENDLLTMLRRDRSHPSVILWSVGNEIPEQSSAEGAQILRRLQDICHREDPSRQACSACDNIASPEAHRAREDFECALDVVGYNYTARWGMRAETLYDEDRKKYPGRRMVGSENPSAGGLRGNYEKSAIGEDLAKNGSAGGASTAGNASAAGGASTVGNASVAGGASTVGNASAVRGASTAGNAPAAGGASTAGNASAAGGASTAGNTFFRQYYDTITLNHEFLWRYTASREFIAGDYLWTGIDYLGEAGWPSRGASSGPIDAAGFAKDAFYYFRSVWNPDATTLHILPHWNWKGREGAFVSVIGYTNCESVSLHVNGRLVGTKGYDFPNVGALGAWNVRAKNTRPTTHDLHLQWDVPYEPGELRAVGYIGGRAAAERVVRTTGGPAALRAETDRARIKPGGIAHIEICAVDARGDAVPDAETEIEAAVSGAAVLLGMDNGDPGDLTLYSSTRRRLRAGKLLCVIRAAYAGYDGGAENKAAGDACGGIMGDDTARVVCDGGTGGDAANRVLYNGSGGMNAVRVFISAIDHTGGKMPAIAPAVVELEVDR